MPPLSRLLKVLLTANLWPGLVPSKAGSSLTLGVTITEVALAVDGTFVSTIPCCSERGDVAGAFPNLPAENTLNSGFGITQNFNLAGAGEHMLTLTITDSSGAQVTRIHTVTVIQPGGFEFLDQVDLSEATAERQEEDLLVSLDELVSRSFVFGVKRGAWRSV